MIHVWLSDKEAINLIHCIVSPEVSMGDCNSIMFEYNEGYENRFVNFDTYLNHIDYADGKWRIINE